MAICVSLNLNQKRIAIFGGGKQAYRKACSYDAQGAQIFIVASRFDFDFEKHPSWQCICAQYHPKYLDGVFLAVAATDDSAVNRQIVLDANERDILSQSIHREEQAVIHAMRQTRWEGMTIAVTSDGAYPALGERLLQQSKQGFEREYGKKLPLLYRLRALLANHGYDADAVRDLLRRAPAWQKETLQFCLDSARKRRAVLFVYHKAGQNIPKELETLCASLQSGEESIGATAISPSAEILSEDTCRLREILQLFSLIGMDSVQVVPVLLTKGVLYQRCEREMQEYLPVSGKISSVMISSKQDAAWLIQAYQQRYGELNTQLLFVMHHVSDRKVPRWLKEACGSDACMMLGEDLPVLDQSRVVRVVPLFWSMGKHAVVDVLEGEQSICARLRQAGYQTQSVQQSMLQQKFICSYLTGQAKREYYI